MKILVLSNDLTERKIIQQVIEQDGHEIISAGNSEEAMQILRQGEIRFVIADRLTTDMDQKQFIKRVRDAKPPYYVYILLLAARVQESDITTPRTGADDYLHKPVMPIELKSRIQIGLRILGLGDNLVQAKDALENTALFDPLTRVLNTRAFISLSHGELERARRAQSPLSLIALDIDNFKSINEEFGEAIGNDVLTVVAQGIREKSRPYDGLGRYAAHTFLIILPGVIGQDAERIAQRITKGIRNTEVSLLDGRNLQVELSAGVASSIRITASTEIEYLIEKAMQAMKQAKREGGNQAVTVFV